LHRERTEEAADAEAYRLSAAELRDQLGARDVRPQRDGAVKQPSAILNAVRPSEHVGDWERCA
jgi:hypothetical protein